MNEEKVGHVLGKLLRGLNARNAGFPWTQLVLGIRWTDGANAGMLISSCFGRSLAAGVLCLDRRSMSAVDGWLYVGVNSFLENEIGARWQFFPERVNAQCPDRWLTVSNPRFSWHHRRSRFLDPLCVPSVDFARRWFRFLVL